MRSRLLSGGLGAAWYSPALFGHAWMAELGKSAEDLEPSPVAMVGSVFSCFVVAVSLALLLWGLGVSTWTGGLGVSALIGFGIVAMTMLSDSLFSEWGWKLYIIQSGYRVLYILLSGAILGGWSAS